MMRVAIRINSLLLQETDFSESAVARTAAVASLAGADSLSVRFPTKDAESWLKAALLAKDVFDGPLIAECFVSPDTVDFLQQLRPDFVVLTGDKGPFTLEELNGSAVPDVCGALRTSGLPFALNSATNLDLVKAARRLEADGLLLPVHPFVEAEDQAERIQAMQQIEAAVIASDRLGLRVFLDGELDRTSWSVFSALDMVEGVILGQGLVQRALHLGLAAAVNELK